MSILSFPRINFRGVFRTNPCTANNDDVMPAIVERDQDTLGATLSGMTDDQIFTYLREQVIMSTDGAPTCAPFTRSGWNLYGDFFTTFEDTVITSVVSGPTAADRATTSEQDPLVGQAVVLLGSTTEDPTRRGDAVICDLDPTGLVTSQLWVGGLQIGSGGETGTDTSKMAVQLDHDTRGFQNWLNFNSTVGGYNGEQNFVGIGCVMQFGIPVPALPETVASASPGMQALFAAARKAAGLVVRFRCFEVQPGHKDDTVNKEFQNGNAVDNPALGYLVGTIGVWEAGEPETEPAGRKLQPFYGMGGRPAMAWQSPDGTVNGSIPGCALPWAGPPALIGNAVARVQPSQAVISLDLVESFPKYGFRDPDGPETSTAQGFSAPKVMANVGVVELAVMPSAGGPAQVIGTIDYGFGDYSAYEDFGGIVDLPYNPAMAATIASGTLLLRVSAASTLNPGVALLQEQVLRIVTDDRAKYFRPSAQTETLRVKLYERGGPTTADTVVYLQEYTNITVVTPGGPCADGIRPNQTVGPESPGIISFPAQVTIPAGKGYDQWFDIQVTSTTNGATILSYQLDNTTFGNSVPAWSTANYSCIRVYEQKDYSALYAKGPLQWADVYEEALRYYYLIFPAMSRYIPLNMADSIVGHGALLKTRLNTPDSPAFYSTRNMPITRSMPPAKVKLIIDFIDQQMAAKTTIA